jgi:glucose uptake protein GlcU
VYVIYVLDEALRQLCTTPRIFLGAFAMICIILGVLFHIANYFINRGKPKTSKKPRLWLAGTSLLLLALLAIVIYILAPVLLKSLGINAETSCVSSSPSVPPYCGAYCHNRNITPASENCTCLLY